MKMEFAKWQSRRARFALESNARAILESFAAWGEGHIESPPEDAFAIHIYPYPDREISGCAIIWECHSGFWPMLMQGAAPCASLAQAEAEYFNFEG
jgi:hypothetical protein